MIPVFIICIIILVFVLINTVLVVTLHLLNKKIASAPLPDKTKKSSTEKSKRNCELLDGEEDDKEI